MEHSRKLLGALIAIAAGLGVGSASAQEATTATAADNSIWTRPSLLDGSGSLKERMRDNGINVDLWWTQFAQGVVSGNGSRDWPYGGKVDAIVTLDGEKLGLWSGFSVNIHQEAIYGQDANNQGDGTFIPVNMALALPRQGGYDTDTSIVFTQKFNDKVSLSVGKFNMLDAASRTPLIGGGGLTTFMNMGLAAPISGVTPPYIIGGSLSVQTAPANFTLLVYDPRSAQDSDVLRHPFADGVTTSLSATVPLTIGGLPGFHTVRGVYSTQDGIDLRDIPQVILPPEFDAVIRKKAHYWYASYAFQQYLYQDPADPRKGWGVFGEVGVSDGNPNIFAGHYIIGVGGNSPLPNRSNDRWGIAYFNTVMSKDVRDAVAPLGVSLNSSEGGVEGFYNVAFTPWFNVTADLQILNPFPKNNDQAVVAGLRTQVRF
ncbi:carbohydrate porin [Mesorhizobium sp. Cs1299R1N1]|uniref:carbohydrate porin n=1 Tax=Mesorhizobium sp. Cs1299R1N1 TaxID=3015172 RepID=UPI00301DBDCD